MVTWTRLVAVEMVSKNKIWNIFGGKTIWFYKCLDVGCELKKESRMILRFVTPVI